MNNFSNYRKHYQMQKCHIYLGTKEDILSFHDAKSKIRPRFYCVEVQHELRYKSGKLWFNADIL